MGVRAILVSKGCGVTVVSPENLRPSLDEMTLKAQLLVGQCSATRVQERNLHVASSLQSYQRVVVLITVVAVVI